MYRSPTSFRHIATRLVVYALMTFAVLFLVAASLLYILGYRFDNESYQIQRSGLVQYITKPEGATINVDGTALSQRTPANSTVISGQHEFVFTRSGYQSWRKTLTIEPGTLTWLNYARLIPETLTVEPVASLPIASQALATPNRQYMAIMPQADKPVVRVYDLADDTVRVISMSATSSDYETEKRVGSKHLFRMVEWDKGGRYLLMKHTYGKTIEWLVFDRQTAALISNVTQTMDVAISSAHIVDDGGPNLIALIDDDIRKIQLARETVSRPLVSQVADFKVYDDTVAYVTIVDTATQQRQVGIVKDGSRPAVVYTAAKRSTQSLRIVIGSYFDKDYIAVADGRRLTLLSGEFPREQADVARLKTAVTLTFPKVITWLQMSPENRFVIMQNGTTFQSYDIERNQLSSLVEFGSKKQPQPVAWLDSYYIWSDASSKLSIQEFDGANQHDINAVAPGFDATITPNGKYLYSIGKAGSGYQLQRVKLLP